MEPDPEMFKCQLFPLSPLFFPLEGGSKLSSPQWCREESLFQFRLVKCSLKRERPWIMWEGGGHGWCSPCP